MEFPTIDAHFWIEREGRIVDIEFKSYDYIKQVHSLQDGMVYKEADEMTQKIMISIFMKVLEGVGLDKHTFKHIVAKGYFPCMGCCFQNCMMDWRDGDVLKFGSMGWRKKDGSGVWWEFGGEDWRGVKAFLK